MDLLKQKQENLKKAVDDTKAKLDTEKEALRQLKEGDQTPEVVAQQQALERQIAADEAALANLKSQMGPFSSAGMQAFFAVGEQVKAVGEKIKSVGEDLSKYVSAPLAALGGASIAAFKNVDDGYDEMIKKTGATGKEAEDLRKIMEHITGNLPTDFDTAGKAIGQVATRFDLAGNDLENLTTKFIKFADLNNTDVATSVDKVQKALAAYGLGSEDASAFLDRLNYTGQQTGISVDKLAEGVTYSAGSFQELGLSIDQAADFIGKIEKSGADTNTVMSGMSKALKTATKNGKPLNKALKELQDNILNGTDDMDGLTMAYELFGKSGDKIYAAVKNGTLDFTTMGWAVESAGGNIYKTFAQTQDPLDKFQQTLNKLKAAGADLGASILDVLAPVLDKVAGFIDKIREKWEGLDPKTKDMIVKIGLVAAAIGPVIVVLGTLVAAIGALMSPIGLVVVAIAAAIAAGVAIYKNWDKIKEKAQELWSTIKEKFTAIKDAVVKKFQEARDKAINAWTAMKDKVKSTIDTIKTTVQNVMNTIRTIIQNIWNTIKTFFSTIWNGIKTTVTNSINNTKNTIQTVMNTIRNVIQTVLNTISNFFSTIWNTIKTTVSTAVNAISSTCSTVFMAIRSTASSIWEGIKSTVTTAATTLKNNVSTAFTTLKNNMPAIWDGIKTAITNPISTAQTMIGSYVNTIKTALQVSGLSDTLSTVWDGIKNAIKNPISTASTLIGSAVETIKTKLEVSGFSTTLSTVWGGIKDAITGPIETAKTTLSGIVDKIKKIFPVDLGKICSISLPTISVSAGKAPWGIGGKGVKPSFSVDWNAQGAIFKQPTIFATPYGWKGVGEAGAEAVLPLDTLWSQMNNMSNNIVNGVADAMTSNDQMLVNAMSKAMVMAFSQMNFSIDNREFARILRNYGAIA